MHALAVAHDAAVQMIDTSIVRVHQHAACIAGNKGQSMGRSRGGLTSKIHAVVDTNGPSPSGSPTGQLGASADASAAWPGGGLARPRCRQSLTPRGLDELVAYRRIM